MSQSTQQIFRDSGLLEDLIPKTQQEYMSGLKWLIDKSGRLNPAALRSIRLPEEIGWSPDSTRRIRIPYGGTTLALAALAETPPTSSPGAVITLTAETPDDDFPSTISTALVIPKSTRKVVVPFKYDFVAGTWFHASVTTAAGSSGVSISLAIKAG